MKAPNEIWIIDVPNAKYFFKRKMNDTDIKYIRDDTLHAPSYDKGYDANKKDYDEVWADLKKAHIRDGKAKEIAKDLKKVCENQIGLITAINTICDSEVDKAEKKAIKYFNTLIAKAKEFLNESTK